MNKECSTRRSSRTKGKKWFPRRYLLKTRRLLSSLERSTVSDSCSEEKRETDPKKLLAKWTLANNYVRDRPGLITIDEDSDVEMFLIVYCVAAPIRRTGSPSEEEQVAEDGRAHAYERGEAEVQHLHGNHEEETSTVCGHIFCKPCITDAILQRKCPACRVKLSIQNIHRIYLPRSTP
ncbi:unnamed protein product [Spirodela intermedia]|uniref:RING-type domain-containing protein n=1 Tax=Spirodela intermedia TaxID=51605 RepID=A0A7I8IQB7_SPIIN|nr:unnamed protein product [Spirodela intermedia]CAA6660071.1 unnamed protein product [Spirodela intermedia]